ncbi:MAG: aminotransferase class III-fold pyridoxal phosphate-dependent enzyme [Myxococcota bacterium]|nr:aminotransferase class III-fold pyridoxal phosphate-dependent enzyme [Myxococcota bacterium]
MSALEDRQRKHVFYTWTAQTQAKPMTITGGQGPYFTDGEGRQWLDFESQVYNCNLGHGEDRIANAMIDQVQQLACAHPAAVFETKAALGEALARICPGDLNRFFLCLSGSEAIENAYKMARLLTGRHKVIARRRSYHGASMGALSLTGDPRRWPMEPGLWGVLRAEDPYCYRCPFGLTSSDCSLQCATHIEHIIQMEGPDSIAAIFLEGITGANGGFIPHADYWPTIREICDRYGILLISDEVCSGFGRTGEWFAVDHWNVVPDMITMAKGLTSGYAPLGAVALREDLAKRFDDETLWCGLTGYAHPVSCAAALAAIEIYEQDDLIAKAAQLGQRLGERLAAMHTRFECIGEVRHLGLWGTIEFVKDRATRTPMAPFAYKVKDSPFLDRLRAGLSARRVHIAQRWTHLFIVPPLCISEETLDHGLDLVEDAIDEAIRGEGP